jgi:hypothetical protein
MMKFILISHFFMLFCASLFAIELKPYPVYLKEWTILKNIKDGSKVVLSKGIYAHVLELDPKRRDQFYVYDKNGIATYLTSSEGVVEVSDDIRILPNVDAQKIYPPKNAFKAPDTVAFIDSQISIHVDGLQLAPFNEIYGDTTSSTTSTRYEVRSLYDSELPFKFGLSLNYQSAYWGLESEKMKLSILSFGPHFKYNYLNRENFSLHLTLGAELAPLYTGSTNSYTDKYTAQLYDLGIESEWPNSFGVVSLGGHFRHHEVALSESNRTNLSLTPKELSINSIGLMIGYKFEWEL